MSQGVDLEISYQQWMHDTTLGHLSRRSSALQALDGAIRSYDRAPSPEGAFGVRDAFDKWKADRVRNGGHWPSGRDRNGAVTALETQLSSGGVDAAAVYDSWTPQERAAHAAVDAANRNRLRTLFDNAKIIFLADGTTGTSRTARSDYVIHPWEHISSSLKDAASHAGTSAWDAFRRRFNIPEMSDAHSAQLRTAGEWAMTLYGVADKAFGADVRAKLKGTGLGQHVEEMIANATASIPPWLGHVWDARSLGQEWAGVVVSAYRQYDIGHREYEMADGDPVAAYLGMRSALRDEILNSAGDATISSVSFLAKSLTAHADVGAFTGPLIGLATALAKVVHDLAHLGFQYRAAEAMKAKLKEPNGLDVTVFRTYPLLGAYFIHCAEMSALIPQSNLYTPGWMNRVERTKKETEYIYYESKQLIDACPFKVVNVQKIKRGLSEKAHAMRDYVLADLDGLEGPIDDIVNQAAGASA